MANKRIHVVGSTTRTPAETGLTRAVGATGAAQQLVPLVTKEKS